MCFGILCLIFYGISLLATLTLFGCLIWFGDSNPDNEGIYAMAPESVVNGVVFPRGPKMISDEMLNDGTAYTDDSNVHGTFVAWFMWGAINFMVLFVSIIIMLIFRNAAVNMLASVLKCYCCCSGIAWFITGLIWRFSASGSFASGDK